MSNPWIYRAPAIGWGFFILYACLAPVEAISAGIDFEISDKEFITEEGEVKQI